MRYPKAVDNIISEAKTLKTIQKRAIQIAKLNRAVTALLPTQLKVYCKVANFRNNVLIIDVANAIWLTRIRYEQLTLLSALRANILPSLASIYFRVNPNLFNKNTATTETNEAVPSKNNIKPLSKESAMLLLTLAEKSPSPLKEKLKRLANHALSAD